MHLKFQATGHIAILSTHSSTIEITKDAHLSTKGDCIVAVNSTLGPSDLPTELKSEIKRSESTMKVILEVDRFRFLVQGRGDVRLSLSHPTDFVIRKSGFISDRTLMIHADKSAADLPRAMVQLLKNPKQNMTIEISTRI